MAANAMYDILTVGGGLGGAALAKVMAERGARVLVLERERQFHDRVRGEQILPWGVAEAQQLGIYDTLRNSSCGLEVRWWQTCVGQIALGRRDCIATTPQAAPQFSFYHPAMQEVMLQAAAKAGAEIARGGAVIKVDPGKPPRAIVHQDGKPKYISARLIVGVDGRTSMVRNWMNFTIQRDPPRRLIAGVLFDGMSAMPADCTHFQTTPELGQAVLLAPEGNGRVRAYLVYQHDAPHRLQGTADVHRFVDESVKTGIPAQYYASVKVSGPLASFDGADTWVEHPYKDGVVLVGDAAASNDPCFGQGLSLTLRDVKILRDSLLAHQDWDEAGHAYAVEHDRNYGVIHKATEWFGQMFYEPGPEADQRRAKALPLIGQDPTRIPDHLFGGPELPLDEDVKRRFFGEE
jgi:2-polyprenyl-6-methoxyphenol hydroxylase-like FAD-dependent oxidoreductase